MVFPRFRTTKIIPVFSLFTGLLCPLFALSEGQSGPAGKRFASQVDLFPFPLYEHLTASSPLNFPETPPVPTRPAWVKTDPLKPRLTARFSVSHPSPFSPTW